MTDKCKKCKAKSGWVSVYGNAPENDQLHYWVLFPDGDIRMCYLNDYMQYGGAINYWQDLSGTDISMIGTWYVEIKQPKAP